MYDIETVHEILNDIVDSIDPVLFEGLNGGVILHEEIKYHEESIDNDLIVLGNYIRSGTIKRINIYYGSIKQKYPYYTESQLKERLEKLVYHELRHHIEGIAKVNDLDIEDQIFIENHKKKRGDY